MKIKSTVLAAVSVLALGFGTSQLSWAAPPPCPGGTNSMQCQDSQVLYFAGKQFYDEGFHGYSTSILSGSIPKSLGGFGAGFIDDDVTAGTNYDALAGQHWNVTATNAAYLGNNTGEVAALTKFGSAIGVNGYAELANLASEEFKFGGRDDNSTTSVTINGVTFAAGTSYPQVSQALNEAIYWIANQGNGAHISGGQYIVAGNAVSAQAAALIEYELATFGAAGGSSSAAIAELKKDNDIWFLNPGGRDSGGKPELILQFKAPEGGSTLAFLLLAGLPCFGAIALFRKRFNNSGTTRVA